MCLKSFKKFQKFPHLISSLIFSNKQLSLPQVFEKFQKFQIAHLISSLIWKFQISNPPPMCLKSFKSFK